jgi:hypothetical protein
MGLQRLLLIELHTLHWPAHNSQAVGPTEMKTIYLLLLTLFAAAAANAGAWGEGSFENDDALDWVAECTRANSVAPVAQAFEAVLQAGYIEATQGSVAVAAAEVVAAALGKPSKNFPPELQAWVRRQHPGQLAQLAPKAIKALTRVQDPTMSELSQLWSEGKSHKWTVVIAELVARLGK